MTTLHPRELEIWNAALLPSVLDPLPFLAAVGFFTGPKAVCLRWDEFCQAAEILIEPLVQSPCPPSSSYCQEIKPSRKRIGSVPKGLEQVQIIIDSHQFHDVLLFQKEKE